MVRSNNGRPPGTASFNIKPTIEEVDSDEVEVLEGLPVGVMALEDVAEESAELLFEEMEDVPPWPLSEWRDHYPYWEQSDIEPRGMIGNSYLMVAVTVLTLGQPYPGDENYTPPDAQRPETWPEMRFTISKRRSDYFIHDALVGALV